MCVYNAILCFNRDKKSELQQQPSVRLPFARTETTIPSPSKVSSRQNVGRAFFYRGSYTKRPGSHSELGRLQAFHHFPIQPVRSGVGFYFPSPIPARYDLASRMGPARLGAKALAHRGDNGRQTDPKIRTRP